MNFGNRSPAVGYQDVQAGVISEQIPTANPGKAIFQNAAIQGAVNDLLDAGSQETVMPWEPVVIDLLQNLKIVFHALIVRRVFRSSWAVYGFRHAVLHLLLLRTKAQSTAKDMPTLITTVKGTVY